MKKFVLVAAGAALCCVALSFDATQDFKSYVQTVIPKMVTAFETKNTRFFADISTADFTETEMGRTYNRKQALAEVKSMFASCKSIKCTIKLISATVRGKVGTAATADHMVIVTKATVHDKAHTIVADFTETEKWVRAGGIWKIQSITESGPTKMTMDGKPYAPPTSGS